MSEAEREPDGTFGDVVAEFDHVDDPDVFERMKTHPALHSALVLTRPENWWGTGLDPKLLFTIAKDEGIPVAWVPPSAVLLKLAAAPDRTSRIDVLLARKQEIVNQCKEIILNIYDPWIANERALIEKAIAAYEDGHLEAATALAVSVGDSLATWASIPRTKVFKSEAEQKAWKKILEKDRNYKLAASELSSAEDDLSLDKILMAPIPSFFTEWHPDGKQNPPDALSRHVVAHNPTLEHFSQQNALLSLMLDTSILHVMQAWCEQVRFMDSE